MRERRDFTATAILLIIALAVGGAGPSFPLLEMLVELAALGLLLNFACSPWRPPLARETRFPLFVLGLILLLPLLQLIALPPDVWSRLPGRELAERISAFTGMRAMWRPLSLDPEATRRCFLALLPGTAMFVAVLRMPLQERLGLVWIVLGFAMFGAILGAVQLASGDGIGVTPYPSIHQGSAVGLFVNRNHQATFLLVSIILAGVAGTASASSRRRLLQIFLALAAIALLGLGTVVTTSRTGTALLPLALVFALLILFHDRLSWRAAIAIGLTMMLVFAVAMQSVVVERTLTRFAELDDPRFGYWPDVWWALRQYRWSGTGFGSFLPVYQAAESLGNVAATLPDHAHNDYLEIALEGGLPALLIIALFLLFLAMSVRRLVRLNSSRRDVLLGFAAVGGIALIMLHSSVDYPLRRLAIETLFGLLAGLLVPVPALHREGPRQTEHVAITDGASGSVRRPKVRVQALRYGVCLLGGGVLGWQIVAAGISRHAIYEDRFAEAVAWTPWSSDAHARLATRFLIASEWSAAADAARRTLAISPIDVRALRTLGFFRDAEGARADAFGMMTAAGQLGWRDTLTQLWLIEASLRLGDSSVAMDRVDALLRRNILPAKIFAFLRDLARNPSINAALARKLSENPPWRKAYLRGARRLAPAEFNTHEALLLRLAATASPPSLEESGGFFRRLVEADQYERAHWLWLKLGGDGPLYDGGFASSRNIASGTGSPFEWQAPALAGTTARVGRPGSPISGTALRIYSGGMAIGVVLRQTILLAPGDYTLSFYARGSGPELLSAFRWELACLGGAGAGQPIVADPTPSQPAGWTSFSGSFHVPKKDCPVQQLRLRSTEPLEHANSLWLDEVRIRSTEGNSRRN